jgi:hypothetical protein
LLSTRCARPDVAARLSIFMHSLQPAQQHKREKNEVVSET